MIFYYRTFFEASDSEKVYNDKDFRQKYLIYLVVVPAVCLAIDICMNKIRIKFSHINFSIFFSVLYLMVTM